MERNQSSTLRLCAVLALAGLVLPAIAALAVRIADGATSDELRPVEPVFVRAALSEEDGDQPASATLVWSAPEPVAVTLPAGVVTALPDPGVSQLSDGEVAVEINGVRRLAQTEGKPFYRPLAVGAQGEDVRNLIEYLVRAGRLSPDAATPSRSPYTNRVASAVAQLQRDIGAPTLDGVFDPSYVVYLPDALPLGRLRVGDVLPGSPIEALALPASLTGVTLVPEGQTADVRASVSDGALATIAGVEVEVEALQVTKDGLAWLEAVLAPDTATIDDARIRRGEPRRSALIPSTAVVVDDGGNQCVFVGEVLSSLTGRPVTQVAPTTQLGVSRTDAELQDSSILANPWETLDARRLTCTS